MRIEINSGGLSSGTAVLDFQSDFDSLIDRSRRMVSSFQAIRSFANNMNGGVGNLQEAVDQIGSRISTEETKASALNSIKSKANSFMELTRQVDLNVCGLVNRNKHEFYDVNPWSKPPPKEKEKGSIEKGIAWLCEKGEEIKEGFNNLKDTVVDWGRAAADSISKAWNNAVDWCKAHKDALIKIAASVAIVAGLMVLTLVTGGTAAVIFGMGAIGAGAGLVTGTAKGIHEYNTSKKEGKDVSLLDSVANNMAKETVKGAASGLADGIGLVGGLPARIVVGEVLQVGGEAVNNIWIEGQDAGAAWSNAVYSGTVSNVVDSATFGLTPRITTPKNQILQYAPKKEMFNDICKYTVKQGMSEELRLIIPKTISSLLFGKDSKNDVITGYFTDSEVY